MWPSFPDPTAFRSTRRRRPFSTSSPWDCPSIPPPYPEEPHTLMEQVKADLRRDFPETVTLMYERLFAYGQKARE